MEEENKRRIGPRTDIKSFAEMTHAYYTAMLEAGASQQEAVSAMAAFVSALWHEKSLMGSDSLVSHAEQPKTHGDEIRRMSDEELALFLYDKNSIPKLEELLGKDYIPIEGQSYVSALTDWLGNAV